MRIPQDEQPTTEEIIQCAKGGQEKAFCVLVDRFWGKGRLMVECSMPPELRSAVDAEDVLQDAWINVYTHLADFDYRGVGSFLAWLGAIIRNRLADLRRQALAGKRIHQEEQDTLVSHVRSDRVRRQLADSRSTPSGKYARAESYERLRVAMRGLSDREREVLSLRFFEQRSVKDTAAELEITEGAVKMATLRGLRALSKSFGGSSPLGG